MEDELVQKLNEILARLKSLGDWSSSNAMRLDNLNSEFISVGIQLLKLVNRDFAGFIMQQDDTTAEVSRAQGKYSKKKSDLEFSERYYWKAINHLQDEIPNFIQAYYVYKDQGNKSL
jgi:hypothetical protein